MFHTSAPIWENYIVDQEPGIAGFHRVGCVGEDGLTVSVGPVVEDAAEEVGACACGMVSVSFLGEDDGSHGGVRTFDGLLGEHILRYHLDINKWWNIFKRLW